MEGDRNLNRKICFVTMLTWLLAGALVPTLCIQPVEAHDPTFYIRADGTIDPPTANITTVDQVTYTFTNYNHGHIIVERSNIIVDGKSYTLQSVGSGYGFNLYGVSNVTLKNTKIRRYYYGIYLNSSSNNHISGNTITSNFDGIHLYSSSNNNISGNVIMTNNGDGIYLFNSNSSTLSGNTITTNLGGIRIYNSSSDIVTGNYIIANDNGIELSDSSTNNVNGNTITGNTEAGIVLSGSTQNSISNNEATDNGYGLFAHSSSDINTISLNNMTGNSYYGMKLDSSSGNNISQNILSANNYGIGLTDSSNNILRNNAMTNNKYDLDIWGSTLTAFMNDIDTSNMVNGKPVYYWTNKHDMTVPVDAGYVASVNSTQITVQNLGLTNNGQGILLAYTTNSIITENNVANNSYGIRLRDSAGNSIYHNKFINNINQVGTYNSVNTWDDGYPSGGNYWSDYTGVDEKSGSNQNKPESDGIGDTAKVINTSNQDHYPLMKPYGGPHDIGITGITKSKEIAGSNDIVNINVKVINYGLYSETFNINVYADATIIGTITNVSLDSRNSTIASLIWNTSEVAKGNYTIKAVAATVPEETETSDNTFVDSWVFVLSSGHDVAIRTIAHRPITGEGYTSPISVTAMNVGSYAETFSVTVYVNLTAIGSQIYVLTSGNSSTLTFVWNTTGFAKGNYIVKAVADTVPGETDISDNTLTDGAILVTKVGDFGGGVPPQFFQCDQVVDGKDLSLFLQCYKQTAPPEAMYLGDLGGGVPPQFYKCDGKVDAKDLNLWLLCFKGLGP